MAVVLALEGIVYAAAPGFMRGVLGKLAAAPEGQLRIGGLIAAVSGVAVAWAIRGG
ncbi:MAG TPA: DUF2065 domain-containing protein [Roseomonas sp.]